MVISDRAMLFVKLYIGIALFKNTFVRWNFDIYISTMSTTVSRLLPKWMQRIFWQLVPPPIMEVASLTGECNELT